MINGDRIRQARELRGMTQKELAEQVGVNQAAIAYIEGARFQPSGETLEAIAFRTGFPPAFFEQPTTGDFPLGSLMFRAKASMTAAERTKAHRHAEIAFEIATHLSKRIKPMPLRIPNLDDTTVDVVTAAQLTRRALGLSPDTPIPNLVNAIERGGVLMLALPFSLEAGDAFSLWAGTANKRAVIVVSDDTPGDRLRFDVAHEIGELVLNRIPHQGQKEKEREANRFASELLLPEEVMREQLVPPITLSSLAPLKPRWGVALQTLVKKARDLNLITERQYRYLFEQISAQGWRTREPKNLDVPIERPRALRQMAEMVYGTPIDFQKLAADTHIPIGLLRQTIDAYAGRDGSQPAKTTDDNMRSFEAKHRARQLRHVSPDDHSDSPDNNDAMSLL